MKPLFLAGFLALSSAAAVAQTAAQSADPKPSTPAIASSTTVTPPAPAAGSNSFTMAQAQSRIEAAGYSGVSGLAKDKDGVWRGTASKGGTTSDVSLDYQGNVLPK
jgi:opacity protein-like surface antigen